MSNIKNNVKKFYNEASAYFSKSRQKTYGSKDATWLETRPYLNKLNGGDKVLDLGCGNGRLLTGVNVDINYLGIDFSEKLIEEAQQLHSNKKFKIADITNKSTYKNLDKFDAIFSIAAFHHIPTENEQIFVLNQIDKHLKKGGFAFITVWNLLNPKFFKNHLKSLNLKLQNVRWTKIPFRNKWDRFLFAFNAAYFKKLVKQTDLKIDKIYYANKNGKKTSFLNGRNLVIVLKHRPT